MALCFRHSQRLDSKTLREAANKAGVSWDSYTILYCGNAIGYKHGDTADATAVKDELQALLGYRPVEIDEPTRETNTDQPQ
jgi:hypothetical protein